MKDLIGQKFGMLTVESYSGKPHKTHLWNCICDCGNTTTIRGDNLISGNTKSCGCNWRKPKDITGKKFGRLTVLGFSHRHAKYQWTFWECVCDCGKRVAVRKSQLTTGVATSCGCYRDEQASKARTKHGLHKTREYGIWLHMKDRCYNKNNKQYKDYGGRGIEVYQSWVRSFEQFLQDMGPCPKGYTIERINNDGNYEPENCCWATRMEQLRNTRRTRLIAINKKVQCLKDWCNELGMPYSLVLQRAGRLGWSIEKALFTPIKKHRRAA